MQLRSGGSMSHTGLYAVKVWRQHVTHRCACREGVEAACHRQVCMQLRSGGSMSHTSLYAVKVWRQHVIHKSVCS